MGAQTMIKKRDTKSHATPRASKSKKRKISPGDTSRLDTTDATIEKQEPTGWEAIESTDRAEKEHDELEREDKDSEKKKISKHAKKRMKLEHEQAIRDAERRRLEGDTAPRSAAEFEQLTMASPNSSYIWIKYMAFLLSMGEIDKARDVAGRAVSTINYREEGEKFNVWVAWLNAENLYGTEERTAELLNKALNHTDGRKLYLAVLDIFDRTEKNAMAENVLKAMCRKYSGYPEVWIRTIRYRLSRGDAEGARRTLDRALQALPKKEHVYTGSQAALLEFKMGDVERGRSMFEGILASYPRRLDLWSVYLDQEIAQGDQQRIRALFERSTHLALPPKKMKFLFKRYLEYEKQHGDEKGVEHVKKKAMDFVEKATNA